MNKTIITVVGKDAVGIIAGICAYLSKHNVNILDITQTIVQGYFNMMMVVDTAGLDMNFADCNKGLSLLGEPRCGERRPAACQSLAPVPGVKRCAPPAGSALGRRQSGACAAPSPVLARRPARAGPRCRPRAVPPGTDRGPGAGSGAALRHRNARGPAAP